MFLWFRGSSSTQPVCLHEPFHVTETPTATRNRKPLPYPRNWCCATWHMHTYNLSRVHRWHLLQGIPWVKHGHSKGVASGQLLITRPSLLANVGHGTNKCWEMRSMEHHLESFSWGSLFKTTFSKPPSCKSEQKLVENTSMRQKWGIQRDYPMDRFRGYCIPSILATVLFHRRVLGICELSFVAKFKLGNKAG